MGAHGFSVHPIGGIVPVMEQQRYADLARIYAASMPELPPAPCAHAWMRPSDAVPDADCAGAYLFDSAAYALFVETDAC